jgi:hypothetical protein
MPKVYRVMTPEGARPLVASSSRGLGVRLPPSPYVDIAVNPDGTVEPGQGGMSVSPSITTLPKSFVPRRLRHLVPGARGNNRDRCWSTGEGDFIDGPFAEGLILRVDTPYHGFIEPSHRMPVSDYLAALAGTREFWRDEG